MSPSPNQGPYSNSRFLVEIDGLTVSAFVRAVLPECRVDVLHTLEGNALTGATSNLPGRVHFGQVTLVHHVTQSRELYEWWHGVVTGNHQPRNLSVVLLDESGVEAVRWNVRSAWPARYEIAPFEADGDELLVEILELVCEGVELV